MTAINAVVSNKIMATFVYVMMIFGAIRRCSHLGLIKDNPPRIKTKRGE